MAEKLSTADITVTRQIGKFGGPLSDGVREFAEAGVVTDRTRRDMDTRVTATRTSRKLPFVPAPYVVQAEVRNGTENPYVVALSDSGERFRSGRAAIKEGVNKLNKTLATTKVEFLDTK